MRHGFLVVCGIIVAVFQPGYSGPMGVLQKNSRGFSPGPGLICRINPSTAHRATPVFGNFSRTREDTRVKVGFSTVQMKHNGRMIAQRIAINSIYQKLNIGSFTSCSYL
jgi:hypothetical protein